MTSISTAAATTKATTTATAGTALIKEEEKGHRVGNFHNYYTFNPTSNRISILHNLNIIHYLRQKLSATATATSTSTSNTRSSDCSDCCTDEDDDEEREKKRLKLSTTVKESSSSSNNNNIITYCDLGCNEGDLTISLSRQILLGLCKSSNGSGSTTSTSQQEEKEYNIHCLGLDIDSNLIQRANRKYAMNSSKGSKQKALCKPNIDEKGDEKDGESDKQNDIETTTSSSTTVVDMNENENENSSINATFETCNIANNTEFIDRCQTFLSRHHQDQKQERNNSNEHPSKEESTTTDPRKRFDLISIFSTTMWIHIHHGDKGLKLLLQTLCSMCNYLIIEPQPSKCYRNVNVRLRKLGLEEVKNVGLDTLTMRADIEGEIEKVILKCGFERVVVNCSTVGDQSGGGGIGIGSSSEKDRTKWNRTLRLYKRIEM